MPSVVMRNSIFYDNALSPFLLVIAAPLETRSPGPEIAFIVIQQNHQLLL
jgi:hypothetical protein